MATKLSTPSIYTTSPDAHTIKIHINGVSGTNKYRIRFGTLGGYGVEEDVVAEENIVVVKEELYPITKYFIAVKALGDDGDDYTDSDWAETSYITGDDVDTSLTIPTITSPSVPGACYGTFYLADRTVDSYRYKIASSSAGVDSAEPGICFPRSSDSMVYMFDLDHGKNYWFKVCSIKNKKQSGWSAVKTLSPHALAGTYTVTNLNDSGAGSLRQVREDAPAWSKIVFDSSLSGGTLYLDSELRQLSKNHLIDCTDLDEPITIDCRGTHRLMVNNGNMWRGFIIKHGYSTGYGGVIQNGCLSHCVCEDNSVSGSTGGSVSYGSMLWKCVIKNNRCTGTTTTSYGAVNGAGYSADTVFIGNNAWAGGACYNVPAIVNCYFENNSSRSRAGGAISTCAGTNTCVFVRNQYGGAGKDSSGGGASAYSTNKCCVFVENYSDYDGGACYNDTNTDCIFIGNRTAFSGGACFYGTHTRCLFKNNTTLVTADYGGGAIYRSTTYDSRVINNTSKFRGGGIMYGTATNTLIEGNSAVNAGGGCYDVTLNNCVIRNNTCGHAGAGCYRGTLTNCSVLSNSSTSTTANHSGGTAESKAHNCVIINNTRSGVASDVGDSGTANYESRYINCLIGTIYRIAATASYGYLYNTLYKSITTQPSNKGNNIQYTTTDTTSSNYIDKLVRSYNDGNYKLCAGSPCVGAGNASVVTATTDMAGNSRLRGTVCDIGPYAYEIYPLDPPTLSITD